MTKTIAVLGATGNQGSSVASHFLALGWHVRGITRSSSSKSAQSLLSRGIQVVEANIDEPSTLIAAFKDAHVIFAVTDFWEPFFARYAELSQISDRAAGENAFAIEAKRGKAIVDSAAQVLKDGILERFIWSTLPSMKEQSKGKYTSVFHYDSKAEVSNYLKAHTDLWAKSSLLNMAFYATNMVKYPTLECLPDFQKSNKYTRLVTCPPATLHPFVVPTDTGIFVDLLVSAPAGQDLLGVSDTQSHETFLKIWTEITGFSSEVVKITVEEAAMALPGGLGREVAESTASSAEFGWGDHLVLPKDLDPNVKTTSLRTYIETEDWKTFLSN